MKYFLYALALAFIVLKLTNFIDWSWWIVLLPIYGGLVIFIPLHVFVLTIQNKRRKNSISDFEKRRSSTFQEKLDKYMSEHKYRKS